MAIDLDVHGNTKPLEAAVQAAVNRIRRQPIKITVDDKGATQPLGNMKRGADEFTKSMEAANARILAFGASMAIINGVANAFKGMVKNLVEVEKAMADVNVVMGLSAQNLEKFSDGLFKVAKETGAAFRVAADAATEYARQGLGVEESLKRTRDALVLTRLTGMDSAEAVKSLTAAMNTYGTQIKDTTQLVSKFAAVDVKFAVSAQDFADAISRTGQSAQSAGVSIDELVGIVTAAQQKTARGGAVIGNALKTIFTKTGKTDTLNQLENLGIAVRDLEGNTIGAQRILNDLANTFDTLSAAQKAQITQTMGGLFHINILKAVLSDAAKQNGIMAEATRISAGATDEAIQKNEELRKTMSAVATETGLAIKQVSAQIGEIALAPGMEKILNTVKSLAEGLSGVLGNGETTGSSFATGFLKGIGNVITGPGLVVLAGVFFKLFGQALKFTKESLTSLVGVTTEKQKQKAIQTSLVALFGQNAALNKEMLRTDIGRTEKEKIILGLLKAQVVEANSLNKLTAGMAGTLYRKGYGANLTPVGKKASGHIPNYANPERAQAAQGGYAAGSIRSMNMPGEGPVIYNSAETVKNFKGMSQPAIMPPHSSKAGKNYQQAFGSIHGFDPYAAGGYIPNFKQPSSPIASPIKWQKQQKGKEESRLSSGLITRGINQNSINYIGLAGSKSSDDLNNRLYVLPGTGDSRIYQSPNEPKFKAGAKATGRGARVNFDFYTLDEYDKRTGFQKIEDEINSKVQKRGYVIVNSILKSLSSGGNILKMNKANMQKDLPDSKMSVVSGHIFEAVAKNVIRSVDKKAKITDDATARIDLPKNKKLYQLFGVKGNKGRFGAEAKINTKTKNVKSFARKIYDLKFGKGISTGQASFTSGLIKEKDKFFVKNPSGGRTAYDRDNPDHFLAASQAVSQSIKQTGSASNTTPKKGRFTENQLIKALGGYANGHIPNFAAMTISRLGGLGKSKFGLAAVINSNPYFAQLLKRYGHWNRFPPQDKAKLNKFLLKQGFSNRALQGYGLASMHSKSIGEGIGNIAAAGGYIPNFADPLSDAIGREKAAGVPVSQIRVGSHGALMGKGNPLGLGVTNTHDEPNGLRDVFGANGFVPNYAAQFQEGDFNKGSWIQNRKYLNKANRMLASWTSKLEEGLISKKQYNKYIKMASRSTNDQAKVSKRVVAESKKYTTSLGRAAASVGKLTSGFSSGYQKTFVGKGAKALSSRMGGNFGITAMMGLPMAAGFLQSGGAEKGGASYKTGGALTGAATGAMMGMAVAPLLGPFGPLAIGLGAVAGGIKGWVDASEENTKALKEKREREETSRGQAFTSGISKAISGIDIKSIEDILKDYSAGGMGSIPALEKIVSRLPDDVQIRAQSKEEKEYFGLNGSKKVTYGKKELLARLTTEGRGGPVTDANKVVPQLTDILGNLIADAEDTGKSDKKSKDAAIRQLNIRLASIKIQGTINDNLNKIKESSMMSQMNFKWIEAFGYTGNELVKSQITYAKALSGAANDLEQKTEELKGKTMEDIFSRLTSSENQQYIKDFLSGIGEGGGIQALQDIPESIREEFKKLSETTGVVDLTQALTGLNYEELITVLDAMATTNTDIKIIRDQIVASHENEQKKLKNNYDLTTKTAEENRKLNDAIGKRVELYKALNREAEYQDTFRDLDNQKTDAGNRLSDLRWKNANRYATELALANRELVELQRNSAQDLATKEQEMTIEVVDKLISKYKELGMTIDEAKFKEARKDPKLGSVNDLIITDFSDTSSLDDRQAEIHKQIAKKSRELVKDGKYEELDPFLDPSDPELAPLYKENEKIENLRQIGQQGRAELGQEIEQQVKKEIVDKKEILGTEEKITEQKIKQKKESLDMSFGTGFKQGIADLQNEIDVIDKELGRNVPRAFADGLAGAMTEAINGTKSIKEGLTDAAISFLGMIQEAMMKKMVYQMVGLPFSQGGNVRNYSRGGGVPAMVSNGEYVMGRDAVAKYGGSFMHGMNAGGSIPGFASGGSVENDLLAKGKIRREGAPGGPAAQGSALAANFGGGRGFDSGRLYQRKAMSGAFYAQSGNVGLSEDTSAMQAILSEEERRRQEAEAKRQAKKAKRRQLLGMVLGTLATAGLSSAMQGGNLTGTAKAAGYGANTPGGVNMAIDSSGMAVSTLPGANLAGSGFTNVTATRSLNPFSWGSPSTINPALAPFFYDQKYLGGPMRKYASGGHIAGKSGIDQIPAMLSEGEYVIRASSARQIGKPMLDQINAGKFYDGGAVSEIAGSSETGSTGGNTNNINISINMERGSSNQKQQKESGSTGKNPADRSSDEQSNAALAERIKQQVVSVIVEEQRPGGLLSD